MLVCFDETQIYHHSEELHLHLRVNGEVDCIVHHMHFAYTSPPKNDRIYPFYRSGSICNVYLGLLYLITESKQFDCSKNL